MSNIYTSYVRFYRQDKKMFTSDEVDLITQSVIKWHDKFGSYHVPIIIENNIVENFLDFQYGSGKGLYHLSDFFDDHENDYTVWHRFNDDGLGIDQIERLYHFQKEIPEYDLRDCKYSFDMVKVLNCSDSFFDKSSFDWISIKNEWFTKIKGYYLTDNGQFLLGGEKIVASKKFELPRVIEKFEFCSIREINDLISSPPENIDFEIQLYYGKRLVTKFCWTMGEDDNFQFKGLAFDDWDNCCDERFIKFHNEHKLSKIIKSQINTQMR